MTIVHIAKLKRLYIVLLCMLCVTAYSYGEVRFSDIASEINGISYERTPSLRLDVFNDIKTRPFNFPGDIALTPVRSRGLPGVVVYDYDYDNDGDQDVYVTNGPGGLMRFTKINGLKPVN